jgi:hypothetical protein
VERQIIREIETDRFYIVDEVVERGVWAHRIGKSNSIQKLMSKEKFELVLRIRSVS